MGEESGAVPSSSRKLSRLGAPLAILSYLLSLPVLAAGIWLMFMRDASCAYLLRMPQLRVALGVVLLAIFLLSNFIAFYGPRVLLPGFMFIVVPLVALFTVGLTLAGAYKMESWGMPASPLWLQNRVRDARTWRDVKGCIYDSGTCADLGFRTVDLTFYDFSLAKLSPIEGGCCKPPAVCGMRYVNATYWYAPAPMELAKSSANLSTYQSYGDCHAWSNEYDHLCYDCKTCKVGFLTTMQNQWRGIGIFLMLMSLLLLVTHVVHFVLCVSERYNN